MRWLTYLVFLISIFATYPANSNPLVLDSKTVKLNLNGHFTYLRDPGGHFTLDDVANVPLSNTFIKSGGDLNFAVTRDVVWLRLEITAAPDAPAEWWLELAPAYIGEVTLYRVSSDAERIGADTSRAGLMLPLSMREFKVRDSTFRIFVTGSEPQIIYLRLRSNTPLNVRATLWQPAFYAEQSLSEDLFLGFYYGSFAVILTLCALWWAIKRSSLDLWWLVYLSAEGFAIFRLNGIAARYFFPEFPPINMIGGNMAPSVMVWAGAHFGIHAFGIDKENCPYSYHAAQWIGNLALLAGFARLLDFEPWATVCVFLLSFLVSVLNCAFAYRFLKSGQPAARFYFMGIWFMTGCVVLVMARNFGLMPAYDFIDYVWQSNLIVHASLISYGIVLTQREASFERRRASDFRSSAEVNLKYSVLQKKMITLVSHEFRNSLAMLNVSMHMLNRRPNLPPEVMERHQSIARVHRQMRLVIDNFLMEERIQNADIKISYRITEIGALIRDVISTAELQGDSHTIFADLRQLPHHLSLDDGILRLTLTNLLDNAVKYSAAGSRILVTGRYGDGCLHMAVSDSGIGMDEDSLSRIFEPHFKADSHSEGIGIGLYMVKTMLEAHEGGLRVTSSIGNGSTLAFWLRVKPLDDAVGEPVPGKRLSQ